MPNRRAILSGIAALAAAPRAAVARERLLIFAAASLRDALDEALALYTAGTGLETAISYAGSSALARQIEQGAPADLFISANPGWVDHLEARGALRADTRRPLFGNRLVLATAADGAPDETAPIGPDYPLAEIICDGRLATALTDAVPAGIYAKAALRTLGLWDEIRTRLAETDDVRAALALAARGETPLAVIYLSDASASDAVRLAGVFPAHSHPPILYPGAIPRDARDPAGGGALLDWLSGPEARAIFARWGFAPLD